MPISTTLSRVTYAGDGVTVAFPVPFVFFGNAELTVIERVAATGAETVKVLTTHYTVAGGDGSTGTVTAVAPPASGVSWTIARATAQTQLTTYTPNDPFPAKTHERGLDRLTALVQELADAVARSAKLSVTSILSSLTLPDPIANALLGWKADLTGIENKILVPASSVVAASVANTRSGITNAEFVTPLGLASQWKKGTDIASAATLAKPADANLGGYHVVTGNVAITALWSGEPAGTEVELRFSGTPTLTHHATNLILPTGANITAAAGDVARFRCEASGQWRCVSYQRADGTPLAAAAVARKPVDRRQCILSGPVNSNGLAAYGGSTGSTTVTIAGTLVLTAAGGADVDGNIDRVGSIVNPSWNGLSTNGTMFLLARVNADGTCTPLAVTPTPIDQMGGTPANTANLFTFNVAEMKGYLGSGGAAPQDWLVKVGEVTVAGGVVTAITWYQPRGRYRHPLQTNLPGASSAPSIPHNLGTSLILGVNRPVFINRTTDNGYVAGDQLTEFGANSGGSYIPVSRTITSRNAVQFQSGNTAAFVAMPKGGGAAAAMTQNSWDWTYEVDRGW